MENGRSSCGPGRVAEIGEELGEIVARTSALYEELLVAATAGEQSAVFDVMLEHTTAMTAVFKLQARVAAAAIGGTREAGSGRLRAPRRRAADTDDELTDLMARPQVWESHLVDFDPPLSRDQRLILAILNVVLAASRKMHHSLTLPRMMNAGLHTHDVTGPRKDAIWLLHVGTSLRARQIADLFGLQESSVHGYISERRHLAPRLEPLLVEARGLARMDLP